jgi:uncharacterized repeat protein (TIGR02543 family)
MNSFFRHCTGEVFYTNFIRLTIAFIRLLLFCFKYIPPRIESAEQTSNLSSPKTHFMKTNFILAGLCLASVLAPFFASSQSSCAVAGWATQNGGTTGGGSATPITVSTLADLQTQASSTGAKVIYVSGTMGSGVGTRVTVAANKTIIGLPGATLFGGFDIKTSNVILRNMKVRGPGAVDVDGVDCITIQNGSNVWIDHCEIWDGQDGNLDISNDANYVTVSWTKFYYTSASTNHQFCNLIGSSDTRTTDRGKLKVTFLNDWWGPGCKERMPRVRFGQVHVVNNYFGSTGNSHCVRAGIEANLLVEGNYFEGVAKPIDLFENNFTAVTVRNNTFVNVTGNTLGSGTAFTPTYALTVQPSANVKATVTDPTCGAGATMSSPTACCGGGTTTFTLTTTATPSAGGTISRSPNAATYASGTSVTLTATPAAGYIFTGWTGDAAGSSSTVALTMDADKNVAANFQLQAPATFTLTTNASPAAGGSVTQSPNATSYNSGTVVTLTATPAAGYAFVNWTGDATGSSASTTVTMDANKIVTANFQATGGTNTTIRIEDNATAATGLCSFDGSISSNSGASNTKVINLTNSTLKGITWSINVPSAGSYSFNWRYTNGGSSNAVSMKLLLNGATINAALGFPKTSSSTAFLNTVVTLNLAAGNNTVRLESIASSATADIDWLEVTGISPAAGNCAPARMALPRVAEAVQEPITIDLFPNPARSSVTVAFHASVKEKITMMLYDAAGRVVATSTYQVAQTGLNRRVFVIGESRPGMYHFVVVHESGAKESRRLTIQ